MWGVPNIQDRADWGGQAWLFQIIHVLCVLKVLARHPSAGPRFAQSNERADESHATRSHTLRARTTPSIVCETSADSLVNVSEASARSEFYTHALAMLRARARTRTSPSRGVHSASARSLRFTLTLSQSCERAPGGNERVLVLASYSITRVQGLLRRTMYTCT